MYKCILFWDCSDKYSSICKQLENCLKYYYWKCIRGKSSKEIVQSEELCENKCSSQKGEHEALRYHPYTSHQSYSVWQKQRECESIQQDACADHQTSASIVVFFS